MYDVREQVRLTMLLEVGAAAAGVSCPVAGECGSV